MPVRAAASLRRSDPTGWGRMRPYDLVRGLRGLAREAMLVLVLTAVVAASSAALASAPAHGSNTPGPGDRTRHPVNPTALWRTFPLGQRRVSREHPIENAPE